jgi:negative regulator of flagellin synthesis FlgM
MKINDSGRIGSVNPYKRSVEALHAGQVSKKDKAKDEVKISAEAKELLGTQSPARSEEKTLHLEELKRSVASGTYHVDAGKVAEKLLPYLK